jgi:hypothetical protein
MPSLRLFGAQRLQLLKDRSPIGKSARRLVTAFYDHPHTEFYAAVVGGSRPVKQQPGKVGFSSSLCRQIHFSLDEYRYWIWATGEPPRFHRKLWERFFIIQTLFERGLLSPGYRGLGFAVGREPLPALFASYGCEVLATDQPAELAEQQGWIDSGEHSAGELKDLSNNAICPDADFYRRVKYRAVDMNAIPGDVKDYDFCWSSCSFEHLGSLEHGLIFVENAMKTLKSGGIAIHTTEFNLTSNDETLETDHLCIYRRRDIERLTERLERAGHRVSPIDWSVGSGFVEKIVDLPPYNAPGHLRLRLDKYDCTSLGLIVQRN